MDGAAAAETVRVSPLLWAGGAFLTGIVLLLFRVVSKRGRPRRRK